MGHPVMSEGGRVGGGVGRREKIHLHLDGTVCGYINKGTVQGKIIIISLWV